MAGDKMGARPLTPDAVEAIHYVGKLSDKLQEKQYLVPENARLLEEVRGLRVGRKIDLRKITDQARLIDQLREDVKNLSQRLIDRDHEWSDKLQHLRERHKAEHIALEQMIENLIKANLDLAESGRWPVGKDEPEYKCSRSHWGFH